MRPARSSGSNSGGPHCLKLLAVRSGKFGVPRTTRASVSQQEKMACPASRKITKKSASVRGLSGVLPSARSASAHCARAIKRASERASGRMQKRTPFSSSAKREIPRHRVPTLEDLQNRKVVVIVIIIIIIIVDAKERQLDPFDHRGPAVRQT